MDQKYVFNYEFHDGLFTGMAFVLINPRSLLWHQTKKPKEAKNLWLKIINIGLEYFIYRNVCKNYQLSIELLILNGNTWSHLINYFYEE